MNRQNPRWEILEKRKTEDIISVLLKNRKIKTEKQKKEFFKPTLPSLLSLKALGIDKRQVDTAIKRIAQARKNKEKVIIYGDYDADGICGTAILWETLFALNLNVLPYIPERFSEGYGLNSESIKKIKQEDPSIGLIITVDHGIVAAKKVEKAAKLGIDVIITDHHEPAKVRPKSFATVHTTKIGGAAVAWILAREVKKRFKISSSKLKNGDGLDLAAIGTIADQLELLGPNRSFAKFGLVALNKTKRAGLTSLFKEASIKQGEIGPYEVGFMIAPRINATGRLTQAMDSLRLICTTSKKRAEELALSVGKTNAERQKIVEKVVLHAKGTLGNGDKKGVIVLASEHYHEGVIGLAAARLVEEFYHPAIVLSKKGKVSKASARSIPGFNIIETIRKLESLYLEGGGHPMAAGFSIDTAKIDRFKKEINKLSVPLLTKEILLKRLRIDLEVDFNQLNSQLLEKLKSFEPTGLGNPTPCFLATSVQAVDARLVGREKTHLKLRLVKDGIAFDAIGFGWGHFFENLTPGSLFDVAFRLEENIFNGYKSLQLKILGIRLTK
jgi:single-stranded-DNA-specific exonuclease